MPPLWVLHWAFWGGIALMIVMVIDGVCCSRSGRNRFPSPFECGRGPDAGAVINHMADLRVHNLGMPR